MRVPYFRFTWVFLLPLICGYATTRPDDQDLLGPYHYFASDTSRSGSFSVITYNVAGLPEIISSAKSRRAPSIREIGIRLSAFDIAHVQEDFNYNRQLLSGNTHLFRTRSKGKIPFGDGLNTLSKFPILELRRISWNDCTGADCFTPKGFTFTRIKVAQNVFIDFYNVHANAYNHDAATAARRNNMRQLCDFIHRQSKGNAVVIMGDLNARYAFSKDNVAILNKELNLHDSWTLHQNKGILPLSVPETPSNDILTISDSVETIDKILYRSSSSLDLVLHSYKLEKGMFSDETGLPLSDHHPVSAVVTWKVRKPSISNFIARTDARF